jgi:transposase
MPTLSKDALLVASRQELIDKTLALAAHVEKLEFEIDWFKRQIFGTKSERFIPDDDQQLMLELGIDPTNPTSAPAQKIEYERRQGIQKQTPKGHGRGQMPTHLPIVKKILQPEGDVSGLTKIGDDVSWYYEMEPRSLYVVQTIRPKFRKADGSAIIVADLPPLPIDKGNAGPGFMAQVLIDKYVYSMPLHRQRVKFASEYDEKFSESWLCDLVKGADFWIKPVHDDYAQRTVQADYLCADETPIPVLTKDVRGKTHRGYFWVYYDPLGKTVIFDYRKSRSRAGPSEFLKNFKGILQVDGYDGYNEIITRNGIRRAACMDHVRRRFEKAKDYDAQRAAYALDAMAQWYEVERETREQNLSPQETLTLRIARTVPQMRAFKQWLSAEMGRVLPKSPIGVAISYALNQWPYFEPFMTDGRVALSNILVENKIRLIAIGRKNFMFIGSHEAAERAARLYTLVSTARAHSIDPFVYIRDLLTQLPAAKNTEAARFLLPAWQSPKEINESR